MKVEWAIPYVSGTISEPDCAGLFFKKNLKLMFFYKFQQKLRGLLVSNFGIMEMPIESNDLEVSIPNQWTITGEKTNHLMCSERFCFSLDSMSQCNAPSKEDVQAFKNREQCMKNSIFKDYTFGDYTVRHPSEFIYECLLNNKRIWKLRAQGYLYTEINNYKGQLFFGTAGQGGRFYDINLGSGKTVLSINTGGTDQIVGEGNERFFLILGRVGKLVQVALDSGEILKTVELLGSTNINSRIYISNGSIFVTTFIYNSNREYKSNQPIKGVINCISI